MMKKIILSIAIVTLLFSCNEEKTTQADQKVNVSIEVLSETIGSGTYARGGAPCEVDDLTVSAAHYLSSHTTIQTFDLVDFGVAGGDPLVLNNVACGNNVFSASTTAANPEIWKTRCIPEVPTEDTPGTVYVDDSNNGVYFAYDQLNDRAKYYGKYLNKIDKIWAIFMGKKENTPIYFDSPNTVNINLKSKYGRLNIVFESNTNCRMCLQPLTGYDVPVCPAGGPYYTEPGKAMAYIFNNETCTDGKEIKFRFQVLSSDLQEFYGQTEDITATIEKGFNKTILYRYDENLLVPATITTTYEPIGNKHEGQIVE